MTSKDDIISRLRNPDPLDGLYSLCRRAAAEIERLRNIVTTEVTFDDWVGIGFANDWITPFCFTHNEFPHATEAERDRVYEEFEDGNDPCQFAVVLSATKPEVKP